MTKDGGIRPIDILATQISWVLHPTQKNETNKENGKYFYFRLLGIINIK